jgi:predicted kinase
MTERRKLSIVCGNAGVGKTTFARGLARDSGALLLDIDTVSERLVVAGLKSRGLDADDRDSPEYKKTYRDAIHETLFAIADDNLDHSACVLVAPFTQERRNPEFPKAVERRLGCAPVVFYLWCRDEIRKKRIIDRDNPRDASKLAQWEEYAAAGQDSGEPPFEHTLIDTSV